MTDVIVLLIMCILCFIAGVITGIGKRLNH